jgi:hypothetical protein
MIDHHIMGIHGRLHRVEGNSAEAAAIKKRLSKIRRRPDARRWQPGAIRLRAKNEKGQ